VLLKEEDRRSSEAGAFVCCHSSERARNTEGKQGSALEAPWFLLCNPAAGRTSLALGAWGICGFTAFYYTDKETPSGPRPYAAS
jgi:hypothetical protein